MDTRDSALRALGQACRELNEKNVQMRRLLHRHPEFGEHLPQTKAVICAQLDRLGVPFLTNDKNDCVIAEIRGAGSGKTIAFRADMDALHLREETGAAFSSLEKDCMHACGHDAHMAMLLSAAEVLQKNRQCFSGVVRLLFEAGEEIGTGGKNIIEAGGLTGADAVFTVHVGVFPELPTGTVLIPTGACTAGKDRFQISIRGAACHGAFPHKGVDPIRIAAHLVTALEEMPSRELAPGTAAVLSFGCLQAGKDNNTIPDTALLQGTLRTRDDAVRDFLLRRMKMISEQLPAVYGGTGIFSSVRGSRPVRNDAALAAAAESALRETVGAELLRTCLPDLNMGSDDFADYGACAPCVYSFLNIADPGRTAPLHSGRFDLNEDVLWIGSASFVSVAIRFLKERRYE